MLTRLKSHEEVFSLIDRIFGKTDNLQVEVAEGEIIIRKDEDVVEKTKGTIENLDLETIKMIAKSEEFSRGHLGDVHGELSREDIYGDR